MWETLFKVDLRFHVVKDEVLFLSANVARRQQPCDPVGAGVRDIGFS
jgi:hypothetical protein